MISNKLQQARGFADNCIPQAPDNARPAFHVTGGVGWINDPNGFSCYKNEYHLFFQYHPYSNNWGPMHWGHVKTKDFVRWERLPVALAPDMEYDKDGCFSGSAVETPDGKHLLMYTGVRRVIVEDGSAEDRQIQCIAMGDGVNYEKVAENPVLTAKDLPEGGSAKDFRDPKLWYDAEEKRYYSVIGNRPADEKGYRKFKMYFAKGDGNFTSLSFRPASGKVRMDRTFSGFGYDIVNNRSFLVKPGKELTVRVVMDRFSIELFFNDGEQAATTMIYTPSTAMASASRLRAMCCWM